MNFIEQLNNENIENSIDMRIWTRLSSFRCLARLCAPRVIVI